MPGILMLRAVGLDHLADAFPAEGTAVRAPRAAHAQDAVAAANDERVHLLGVAEEAQPLHSEPGHGVLFSPQEGAEASDLRAAEPFKQKREKREREINKKKIAKKSLKKKRRRTTKKRVPVRNNHLKMFVFYIRIYRGGGVHDSFVPDTMYDVHVFSTKKNRQVTRTWYVPVYNYRQNKTQNKTQKNGNPSVSGNLRDRFGIHGQHSKRYFVFPDRVVHGKYVNMYHNKNP